MTALEEGFKGPERLQKMAFHSQTSLLRQESEASLGYTMSLR